MTPHILASTKHREHNNYNLGPTKSCVDITLMEWPRTLCSISRHLHHIIICSFWPNLSLIRSYLFVYLAISRERERGTSPDLGCISCGWMVGNVGFMFIIITYECVTIIIIIKQHTTSPTSDNSTNKVKNKTKSL